MERSEIERRNDVARRENNRQMATYQGGGSAAGLAWKIVGGTLAALIAAAVISSLPDIKRYIKISRM